MHRAQRRIIRSGEELQGAVALPRQNQAVALPHCAQNFAPGCTAVPHWVQAVAIREPPHCWQNRAPGALAARHA